jgi:glyceraldehyde-3-phosphate dehydrogenase (NADP+)
MPIIVRYDPTEEAQMTGSDLARAFPKADEIPPAWRFAPDDSALTLLVGGRLETWEGPRGIIRSAVCAREADGTLRQVEMGSMALASAAVAQDAVAAATRAWAGGRGEWPRAGLDVRIRCVQEFTTRMRALRERVCRTLMWEVGKSYADCLTEFDRTVRYFDETIETLLEHERGGAAPVRAGGFAARVRRAPLGVALCMGPYNYAINEVFTTVIPALLMGNPVIMKTPRYGILSNALLASALAEAFPPGVVNLITGEGPVIIGPIMESGQIEVLAFIGSAKVAKILQRQHPRPYRLRQVLGLGAKNPAIVLEDADLDQAVREIVSGALTFGGQRCTAIKHVFVPRRLADALVERLSAAIQALKIGMPWEDGVVITPMPDPQHPAFLEGLIRDAQAKGARVVNPGGGEWAGTLFRPALVYPVPPEALLYHVEQFGPVVPVTAYDQISEVLDAVDRAEVGQQAAIFGRDASVIGGMVDHLANVVCRVNINTQCRRGPDVLPFTARKDSGLGTLSIFDALRTFSIRSLVATAEAETALLSRLESTSSFLAPPRQD